MEQYSLYTIKTIWYVGNNYQLKLLGKYYSYLIQTNDVLETILRQEGLYLGTIVWYFWNKNCGVKIDIFSN